MLTEKERDLVVKTHTKLNALGVKDADIKSMKKTHDKLSHIEDPVKNADKGSIELDPIKSPFDEQRKVYDEMNETKDLLKQLEKSKEEIIEEAVEERYPDAAKHKQISLIKSGFRIVAGFTLAIGGYFTQQPYMQGAGLMLVIAEIFGVVEELV